ncbi:hypothetical protein PMG11_06063 [Penicillium brasilianum]|uniref:Rhodopsin domain-containing protein n=1 Tax=Penicillium brasilianum TaxID=104259 RepID=A0A0F7TPL6_PENBI|nr:hypothetical protein PMG11_06063 [Penicillium brasilianum]
MASIEYLASDNTSWRIYVGTIITIVPATIVVVLRFIARHVAKAGFWWDDYTIVGALIINWALAATRWVQIADYGLGQHYVHAPPGQTQALGKSFLATEILYFTNAVLTKGSLLLLYHRIFGVVKGFRWALWASGALVIGYYIACVIVSIAGCRPVSKLWDSSIPGTCIDLIAFFRWNGVGNMLLDVLILCLPYPMAWRLQTTLRQKWILTGIFLLGGFVCVVSVLRITSFDFDPLDNITYDSVVPSTWSSIEQSVGIICACLPTIRPLLRWLTGSSASSIRKRDSSSSEFPQGSPLSGRRSQTDEENSLDSLASPTSPTPLVSQMNSGHNRVSSSPAMDTIEDHGHSSWTLEESSGNPEGYIPRPESFA